MKDVLVSLRKVKQEIAEEMMPKADMWCHFGKVTIEVPDRGSVSFSYYKSSAKFPLITSCSVM